jgi:hypothetical protein
VAQRDNVVVGAKDVVLLQHEGSFRHIAKAIEEPEERLKSVDVACHRAGTGNMPDHVLVDQDGENLSVARAERVCGTPVRRDVRMVQAMAIIQQTCRGWKSEAELRDGEHVEPSAKVAATTPFLDPVPGSKTARRHGPISERPPRSSDLRRWGSYSVPFASAWRKRGVIVESERHHDHSRSQLIQESWRRSSSGPPSLAGFE